MSTMDPRIVLKTWIGDPSNLEAPAPRDRRGRRGGHLRGTSPARYAEHVADWIDFIEDTVKIGTWSAEPSHIKTWLDMRGGAPRVRALRVSAVGSFYAYAVHFKHALHNPVDPRLSGKAHLGTPPPRLTEGEVHLIRWGADQLEDDYAERDRLLVYLLLSGLRSRQVCEINLDGVTFEQSGRMLATVWQRGGGLQRYAFPDEIRDRVKAYVPLRTWKGPDSHKDRGPLLVTYRGHRLDPQTSVRTILKQAVDLARLCPDPDAPELPARVTPDMVALSASPFAPLQKMAT
jgi:site-specific recombinase XerD